MTDSQSKQKKDCGGNRTHLLPIDEAAKVITESAFVQLRLGLVDNALQQFQSGVSTKRCVRLVAAIPTDVTRHDFMTVSPIKCSGNDIPTGGR